MAEADLELTARIARGFADVDASDWQRLAGTGDPFLDRRFLAHLEASGSVGEGTGWQPLPLLVDRGAHAVSGVPAYLKFHSQGEYVFDHGWAEAWERAGGQYYPKLQVSVPFSPVVGRRLLGEFDPALAVAETIVRSNDISSAHVTFCTEAEADAGARRGWIPRIGLQFHWFNRGYASFEDFLGALSSRKRKAIRKEREKACEEVEIVAKRGAEITVPDMDAMWAFYQDTGSRKWGRPYLTKAFFDGLVETMGDAVLLFLANRDGHPVAGALNFVGADTLYGRYWGCVADVPFLHFELSYYRAIEWAIDHGRATVQAGAQGEHKLARGYEPVFTHSLHFIPDKGFREAVREAVNREMAAVVEECEWARAALPYRESGSP